VGIPVPKSIINPRLSAEIPGIDRFFGKSAIHSHRWLNKFFWNRKIKII
jgi:cation diffusion facilitator CzcD-associated flavoprotein CzcO